MRDFVSSDIRKGTRSIGFYSTVQICFGKACCPDAEPPICAKDIRGAEKQTSGSLTDWLLKDLPAQASGACGEGSKYQGGASEKNVQARLQRRFRIEVNPAKNPLTDPARAQYNGLCANSRIGLSKKRTWVTLWV